MGNHLAQQHRGELPPSPASRGGRPSLFTLARQIGIVEACRKGWTKTMIARANQISPATLNSWLREGELYPEGMYGPFSRTFRQVEAEMAGHCVDMIMKAADNDPRCWTARAWYLERRYPKDFGRRSEIKVDQKITHSGSMTLPNLEKLSQAQLYELERLLALAEGGQVIDLPPDQVEVRDGVPPALPYQPQTPSVLPIHKPTESQGSSELRLPFPQFGVSSVPE